jgi:hypothetical protein
MLDQAGQLGFVVIPIGLSDYNIPYSSTCSNPIAASFSVVIEFTPSVNLVGKKKNYKSFQVFIHI